MLRVVATAVAAAALALATAAQNGTGGQYPDGARLYGISFSPFGLGSDVTCPPWVETPGDSFCLSATKARADMSIIRQYTKRIKTYSLFCEEATTAALQFARETGMTVILGIWITQDEAANDVELEKFSRVMAEYGDVVSEVMVGNEPVFILKVKEWRLAQYIWQVKGIVNALPADKRADGGVGTAEIYPAWVETCTVDTSVRNGFDMSAIAAASDWIGLYVHSLDALLVMILF
jgi:exo-beta-1,3-glucanase (GH17 family)